MSKWVQAPGDRMANIARIVCGRCKTFAWVEGQMPIAHISSSGARIGMHHPACPYVTIQR